MNSNEIITQIYRETIGRSGNLAISRQDAFEEATADILHEVEAGNVQIDLVAAIRSLLVSIDESDGARADNVIKAAARGDMPLCSADLDLVVTLGAGMRKQWAFITSEDLSSMNETRYRNFKAAAIAYQAFKEDLEIVRPIVRAYGTFGEAFQAGGFPPVNLFTKKVA